MRWAALIDTKSLFASRAQFLLFLLILAGLYAVLGYIFVLLARPPGLASPLYPPAGLTFVAGIVHPLGAWSAAAGSFLSNVASYGSESLKDGLEKGLWISVGVLMQSLFGRFIILKVIKKRANWNSVELFKLLLICAPIICVVSASWTSLGMLWFNWLPKEELNQFVLDWWIGDIFGVILCAPITFTGILGLHKYRDAAGRIYAIVLGNILICGLCILTLWHIGHWNTESKYHDLKAFNQLLDFEREYIKSIGFKRLEFYSYSFKNSTNYEEALKNLKNDALLFEVGTSSVGVLQKVGSHDYMNTSVNSNGVTLDLKMEKKIEVDTSLVKSIYRSKRDKKGIFYQVENGKLQAIQWMRIDTESFVWLKKQVYENLIEKKLEGGSICINNSMVDRVDWVRLCQIPEDSVWTKSMIDPNVEIISWMPHTSNSWSVFILSIIALGCSLLVSVTMIASVGKSIALERTMVQLSSVRKEIERTERLAALGRLVSGISHEVLGPLGNARLLIGSIREDYKNIQEKLKQSTLKEAQLEHILEKSDKKSELTEKALSNVVELMQAFKGSSVGMHSNEATTIEVRKWINEFELSTTPSLKESSARLEVIISPETPKYIKTHIGVLNQALSNVIQNALFHGYDAIDLERATPLEDEQLRFMRKNKIIRVSVNVQVKDEKSGVSFQVRDWGVGLTQESENRAFEPFFTTKAGRGGSGLGLAISYENLIRIGGHIDMVRDPKVGALVRIWIPDEINVENKSPI